MFQWLSLHLRWPRLIYGRCDGSSFRLVHLELDHVAVREGEFVAERAIGHGLAHNYLDCDVIARFAGKIPSHLGIAPLCRRRTLDLPMFEVSIGALCIHVPKGVRI